MESSEADPAPKVPVVGTPQTAFQPYRRKPSIQHSETPFTSVFQDTSSSSHPPGTSNTHDAFLHHMTPSASYPITGTQTHHHTDSVFQSLPLMNLQEQHPLPQSLMPFDLEGDRSLQCLSVELMFERAKIAITKVQRTKAMLKDYFQSFDQNKLTPYQLPRVTALLNEANLIGSVELNPNQSNIQDLMRLIRCCTRQADWLMQILVECQSIMLKEGY